jgi:hypothetical protein
MDPDRPIPPGSDPVPAVPSPDAARPPRRRLPPGPILGEVVVVAVVVALIAGYVWVLPAVTGSGSPSATASASLPAVSIASASAAAPSTVAGSPSAPPSSGPTPHPTSTTVPGGPIARSGGVVVLGDDGSLSVVDAASSRETVLATADDGQFLFPAWSPDGSRIAAIRLGSPNTEIDVFDAARAETGEPTPPVIVLRSVEIGPFYLSWSPDSKAISYLANEPNGLSLRIAPADGSAPIDGSGPGARIKTGAPFYYDWIASDRLLAHVGTGPDAFLGELAIDGSQAAPAIQHPGDFRSASVSHDGKLVGYIRAGSDDASNVVLAARDGSTERTMPVFGPAAVTFDPAGSVVASIGPNSPRPVAYTFPFGPLRVLDAKGKARTLLGGQVVGFWWSPDGKTIAALRVQPVGGAAPSTPPAASPAPTAAASADSSASLVPTAAASPEPSPSEPPSEVRLLFVDVATGKVGSQLVVAPGTLFVRQFLTYFDQYAVSHQLWAPDSSSMLLPIDDAAGNTSIAILPRKGGPARSIGGAMAFWSP